MWGLITDPSYDVPSFFSVSASESLSSGMSTLVSTAASPHDDERGSVRFDAQCVVIPEPQRSRRTRLVTKTYSLPLWKRRSSLSGPHPDPDLVLRVPLPRSVTLPSISLYHLIASSLQTRVQSPTRSADVVPLTPCLVHRSPELGLPTTHRRHPSKSSVASIHADLVTVPLRPCCTACQEITDAARLQGDAWPERFSHAARYRRSLSVDSQPRTLTVAGSAAAASFGSLAHGVPISVDEVDKRHKSGLVSDVVCLNDTDMAEQGRHCCVDPPSTPIRVPQLVTNIPEEAIDDDEDQLFPLPSPKRTPCSSAAPSPSASLSSLQNGQVHRNSSNSPALSNYSGESPAHGSSRFLAPPLTASTSSLSLPRTSECSYSDLTEDSPRAPSPHILDSFPPLTRGQQTWCSLEPSRGDYSEKISQPRPGNSSRSPQPSTPVRIPSRSVSTSTTSPSTSPSTSPNTRRILRSFSTGSPRQVITDVIRGVGVLSGRGITFGMQ